MTNQRRSYLELGALPGAVPCARLHARHLLWEWGQASLAETTELLVTELVTNAVTATAGRDGMAVCLQLILWSDWLAAECRANPDRRGHA